MSSELPEDGLSPRVSPDVSMAPGDDKSLSAPESECITRNIFNQLFLTLHDHEASVTF